MTTANPPPGAYALEGHHGSDPFTTGSRDAQRQRYSAFDNAHFSLYLDGSPEQAKRALQAHLSETARRLAEASQLGESLLGQRKELEERLKEVEKQREDTEIGPELRQRLAELEKEYHEVGRETARTFLPRSRVPSGEADAGGSMFAAEAQHSPSKVSVPSRKQRNQQPSRVNDIALATEISTSLLSQLRELQSVLVDKDEALKAANLDRSQLEIEVEGLSQRLRTIDESESRLKDVNWNLETQVREFEAASKAAADKEHRMNQSLNATRTEKSTLERELEELKQLYSKLTDDHTSRSKHHETELTSLRRNVSMGESERGALQRKVDELASQNNELARAVAYRVRAEEQLTEHDTSPSDGGEEGDTLTPEHSPPPSPSKATPRHGQLESETLKHSLHHAHRMIQQLKNNIHREKTEKIELKRMLQDARDELEINRNSVNGPGSAGKRRKNDKDVFKKPARPDRLGALRTGSQEVMLDDDEWEEQEGHQATPSRRSKYLDVVPGAASGGFSSAAETGTDDFETANETSDAAFETANERDGTTTETDAFQTGAETLDGDSSDDLTETEGDRSGTVRIKRPSALSLSRKSYESTASTSGDEDDYDVKTPVRQQDGPRYKLKGRQAFSRRSTPRGSQELFANTPPPADDSPASFITNSNRSTPMQGKSLFAELGDFGGESEDGSVAEGTPSRSSILSPESSPETSRRSLLGKSPLQSMSMPRPVMVDSSMMTEPWPVEVPKNLNLSSVASQDTEPVRALPATLNLSTHLAQGTEPKDALPAALNMSTHLAQGTEPKTALPAALHMSTHQAQDTMPRLAPMPTLNVSQLSSQDTTPQAGLQPSMNLSTLSSQDTAPAAPAAPSLSTLASQHTEPVSPVPQVSSFAMSSIAHQHTEPKERTPTEQAPVPLHVSSIASQVTEPLAHTPEAVVDTARAVASADPESESKEATEQIPLQFSPHILQATNPREVQPKPHQFSGLSMHATAPMEPPAPRLPMLSTISHQSSVPVEVVRAAPSLSSNVSAQSTEPIHAQRPELSRLATQATEPTAPAPAAPLQFSVPFSLATHPVEALGQTLTHISATTVHNISPVDPPTVVQPQHRVSDVLVLQETQPESPTLPSFLPSPSRPSTANRVPEPALTMSNVEAQETQPAIRSRPVTAQRNVPMPIFSSDAVSSEDKMAQDKKLDYFSGTLPWSSTGSDKTAPSSREERVPLGPIASNAVQTSRSTSPVKSKPPMLEMGTQTMVSADQIDKLLAARSGQRQSASIVAAGIEKRMSPPASPRRNSADSAKAPRRPGSSSSMRSRAAPPPPLPSDHKEVIAAALKSPPLVPPSSSGSMGPPVMPASAYKKRPVTPTLRTNHVAPSPKTGGTTPRARNTVTRAEHSRSGASSPVTRRSSMSSFVSEVDNRFMPGLSPFAQTGLDPNTTDPRMIQAITQTMIGEFLWKYTRKAGSENMSQTRHRRFFWVHPYTRTLYWSEQDPAAAGRAQLKAKSVAIEDVQVVSDGNPYPPGLHNYSLLVITPGRTVKFTATTSQRHETWFNALTYLLMRTGEQESEQKATPDEIQNEFNPAYRSSSRNTGRSRASMSTYASRQTSYHDQVPTLRPNRSPQRQTAAEPNKDAPHWGRMSSLSSVIRNSFVSRHSQSNVADTAVSETPHQHKARLEMANAVNERMIKEHEMDGMENVRACCDGKHDVGGLHQHGNSRHNSYTNNARHSHVSYSSKSSRSHSRASGRQE